MVSSLSVASSVHMRNDLSSKLVQCPALISTVAPGQTEVLMQGPESSPKPREPDLPTESCHSHHMNQEKSLLVSSQSTE